MGPLYYFLGKQFGPMFSNTSSFSLEDPRQSIGALILEEWILFDRAIP